MKKTKTEKIKREDLENCKYINDIEKKDGKIYFWLKSFCWNERGSAPSSEIINLYCPDLELISISSFYPTHYKEIAVGTWINSLIDKQKIEEESTANTTSEHEELLDKALLSLKQTLAGESDKVDLIFIEAAVAALRKTNIYER